MWESKVSGQNVELLKTFVTNGLGLYGLQLFVGEDLILFSTMKQPKSLPQIYRMA